MKTETTKANIGGCIEEGGGAIFLSVFSTATLKLFLLTVLVVLATTAFLLPSEIDPNQDLTSNLFQKWAESIRAIGANSTLTTYRFAYSVSSAAALLLAFFAATFASFTMMKIEAYRAVLEKRRVSVRVLLVLGSVIVLSAPMLWNLSGSD